MTNEIMTRKMIQTDMQESLELWDITLGEMMRESAATMLDHEMIKYSDRDYRRSYAEFDEETDLIARAFIALGIEKGDSIAMWAGNIPEWIISLYAAAKVGAVLVTVNTSYKVFEIEYMLRQSDTKMLIITWYYFNDLFNLIVFTEYFKLIVFSKLFIRIAFFTSVSTSS